MDFETIHDFVSDGARQAFLSGGISPERVKESVREGSGFFKYGFEPLSYISEDGLTGWYSTSNLGGEKEEEKDMDDKKWQAGTVEKIKQWAASQGIGFTDHQIEIMKSWQEDSLASLGIREARRYEQGAVKWHGESVLLLEVGDKLSKIITNDNYHLTVATSSLSPVESTDDLAVRLIFGSESIHRYLARESEAEAKAKAKPEVKESVGELQSTIDPTTANTTDLYRATQNGFPNEDLVRTDLYARRADPECADGLTWEAFVIKPTSGGGRPHIEHFAWLEDQDIVLFNKVT